MDFTPNLSLPFLLPNQAQKHVTLNDALQHLDILVQLAVISTSRSDEPSTPDEGDTYILPTSPVGTAWSGMAVGTIASFIDNRWVFISPREGWQAYDLERTELLVFEQTSWSVISQGLASDLTLLGVNTLADVTNRLAVKSDAELLSHDDVTPGSGDARKIINKAAPDKTASIIFQDGFAPCAELGLTGDDDLHLKVFDGTTWHEGAKVARATGQIQFPSGVAHAATGNAQHGLILLSGGDGQVSIYRNDVGRSQNPRIYTIASTSGDTVLLSTPDAATVFNNAYMQDVCLLRVWNVTRTPAESAWITQTTGTTGLQVLNAATVSNWQPGDILQVGDPLNVTPNRCIALDISPMLQNQVGAVFAQAGVLVKVATGGVGGSDSNLDLSPNGANGSFIGLRSLPAGILNSSQLMVATPTESPVSSSNLVFLRENDFGGQLDITLVSVQGLLA